MRMIDADVLRDNLQNLAYDDWNQGVTTSWADAYREIADMVEEMPTIEERKTGKWIPVTKIYKVTEGQFPQTHIEWVDATEPDEIDGVRCSECGTVYDFIEARNWCSECGARMVR